MTEEIIPGVETIANLIGVPPKSNAISKELQNTLRLSIQGWNALSVAIIPYCYKCKEPLSWHTHPEGEVLFHCPVCSREWVKGEGWE